MIMGKETKPPQRFTDWSLSLIMEKASKYNKNNETTETIFGEKQNECITRTIQKVKHNQNGCINLASILNKE